MSAETLLLGLLGGLLIGVAYFGGLWWTVERIPHARRPGALLAASYLVRTVLALAAFAALVRLGPGPLVAALVGFVAARAVVVRRRARVVTAAPGAAGNGPKEANDDPLA